MEPSSYCHRKLYSVVNVRLLGSLPLLGSLRALAFASLALRFRFPRLEPLAFFSFRFRSRVPFRFPLLAPLPSSAPSNPHRIDRELDFFNNRSRSSPRPISIGKLHVLPHFHRRPIYLIVSEGSYQLLVVAVLFFRGASRLDAFSVYPVRTSLPCDALGRTTVSPEVRPSRSSRTRDSSRHDSNAHNG